MKEREHDRDPYWHHDFRIEYPDLDPRLGVGVRFKAHQSAEPFLGGRDELVPLTVRRGTRQYFHGRPYVLQPDYRLTVVLHSVPPPTGEVGVVEESRWEGMRHAEIGNAQAWYYPEDRTLILWESFLEQRYRSGPPQADPLHQAVWTTWEAWLRDHCPGLRRIVTTWEDIYERGEWQEFLRGQGYEQLAPAAFVKEGDRL